MTCYLRVELSPGGIAVRQEKMEMVDSIANATPLNQADADYIRGVAIVRFPKFKWKVEGLFNNKYVVWGMQTQ